MKLRRSPTLQLASDIEQARAKGNEVWSLSTPTFPEPRDLPQVDATWVRLSHPKGLAELRARARVHFFGNWSLPDHDCIITAGAKAGLFAALRAALAPGSYVLIPTPAWPSYFDICAAAGLNGIAFETDPASDFALDLDRLERESAACGARAVILANPCNPTGRILPTAELAALADLCRRQDMLLVLDQSFSHVIFDEAAWASSVVPSFDRIVLIDSFSKNYILQGARVAAALVPKWLSEPFVTVHQTIVSAAPTPGQKLALHALDKGFSMPSLARQREMARAFIDARGWRTHDQKGTFYFFPEVPDIDAFRAFARSRNVFILTGEAFGTRYGRHFRFCFCKPEEELRHVIDLLGQAGHGNG
jgi:aspartate/methionine/tyrosine aminotransferase